MNRSFGHEKLDVYRASLKFAAWTSDLLRAIPKKLAAWDQLDRSCSSIPYNIAEGNGRFTAPDRCRFFDIARGSALECAACLDVLHIRTFNDMKRTLGGKKQLRGIVSMLVGLVRSNSAERFHEPEAPYVTGDPALSQICEGPAVEILFDHERLVVYQRSLAFIRWCQTISETQDKVCFSEKLDRASTSIPLNIAEGNGKWTSADRCAFFDRARSSALACASCLDICVARGSVGEDGIKPGKELLQDVAFMLLGLIRNNSHGLSRKGAIRYPAHEH